MDRQSDRLPRQTRCEGMRIEREFQMGAAGGARSLLIRPTPTRCETAEYDGNRAEASGIGASRIPNGRSGGSPSH